MSKLKVRPFIPSDKNSFIGLGQWLQSNSHFKDCGFSPSKLAWLFTEIVNKNPDYFGVIVETEDGKPVGTMIAMLQTYFFSEKKLASDLSFGLLPEYRDTSAEVVMEMLSRYERWAKQAGAIETTASTSTGAHGDKLEKLLHSAGYKTVGFITKKRIG